MDFNIEKLSYYLGGVGFVLLLGVVWYIIKGKKDAEEELKKKLEEGAAGHIGEGSGGLYTLCPTNPGNNNDASGIGGDVPDILISDPDGEVEVESKINSVIPRVIYTNYPKTEEERVNARRDMVIEMILADGGEAF